MQPIRILAGAAVVALALTLWLGWGTGALPPPRIGNDTPTQASDTAAAGDAAPSEVPSPRQELRATAPASADLSHPFAFELACTVIDRDGLPVPGAVLFVAPRSSAFDTWPEATGDDGKATLRWRGRQPAMTVAVGVRKEQLNQVLQEVAMQAGAPRTLVLLGEQRPTVHYRVVAGKAADGTAQLAFTPAPDCKRDGSGRPTDCRSCHEGPQLRSVFDGRLRLRDGLHPEAQFADLLLPSAPEPQDPPTSESDFEVSFTVSTSESAVGDLARLAGTVYGSDGKPADGVTVVWGRDTTAPSHRTRTRQGGQFAFDHVPVGTTTIRAGGGDAGLATATVQVLVNATARSDLFLTPGASIRGRALGASGAPLARWRVEYVSDSWADACTTHEDGSFVLPNLPAGPARLLLWARSGTSLPAAIEPTALPDSGEVVFDLRQRGDANGSLRLFAALPDNVARSAAEVRAWQQDSGRGAAMEQKPDGSFVLDNLAAGFYRIEIGAEAIGWRDLGAQWVDGKGLADLGRVELPRPGRVRIARGEDIAGVPEFYLRRPDCDVRAEDASAAAGDELLLPAGEWLCLWKAKDGALRSRPFTLRGGEVVEVRVGGD